MEFTTLFTPTNISSESRARAFLWLTYHYLESSSTDLDDYDTIKSTGNPFCDTQRPGKAPAFVRLTPEEQEKENVDSEEEKALGAKLVEQRLSIINAQAASKGNKDKTSTVPTEDDESLASGSELKGKGKSRGNPKGPKEKKASGNNLRKDTLKEQAWDIEYPPHKPIDDDAFSDSKC